MTRSAFLSVVVAAPALLWGAAFAAWRWTLRRLGLTASRRERGAPRAKLIERNLRAWLAFDFLLAYPFGIPLTLLLASDSDPALRGASCIGVFSLVISSTVACSLARSQTVEEHHASVPGEMNEEPSVWIDPWAAVLRGARASTAMRAALITMAAAGPCLVVAWVRASWALGALGFLLFAVGAILHEFRRAA